MDALWRDAHYAFRALAKAPGITAMVVASLGLAIAGNTAVFSLVSGLLYRPLPYPEPERLALVGEYQDPALAGQVTFTSAPNFLDWKERQGVFAAFAAFATDPVNFSRQPASGERGEPVTAAAVTPGFFSTLGVQPPLGRSFLPEEGRPGAPAARVVLLDHRFWQTHFRGDPGVVGESVLLNGEAYTVLGVLPEGFEFLVPEVRLWRPLAPDPAAPRNRRDLLVMARLAPRVSISQANAAMTTLGEQLAAQHPEATRGYTVQVLSLQQDIPSSQDRQLLVLLQGALVFVLLIACANVANLLLVRTQRRVTELAIRASLGAGRLRIARQLATESLVTAASGGLLGLLGGVFATRAIAAALAPRLPRFWLPTVDVRVVVFTAGITVFAGLAVGLLPAFQAARIKISGALRESGRGGGLGTRRRLVARALVVAEIALALMLLGGGAVMIRSFLDVQRQDPGFDTAPLVSLRVGFPESGEASPASRAAALEEIVDRLAALPGVGAATAASARARTPLLAVEPYSVDGVETPAGQTPPSTATMAVDRAFFATIGTAIAAGRGFLATDGPAGAPVAIVNQSLARQAWPGEDPVGRQVTVRGTARRVVGVVPDLAHSVFYNTGRQAIVYLPLAQDPPSAVAVTLRAAGDPTALAEPVRRTLEAYDPGLVVSEVQSLDAYTAQFFVGMQLFTVILGGFGALALLLAALGTYGVLAYAVAQRSHEIGVRMALGARASQLRRMVTRQGLVLAAVGIALGVPGVILITRVVGSALAGLATVQPLTVVAVAAVLAAVTVAASWLPARRAASLDPVRALRGD